MKKVLFLFVAFALLAPQFGCKTMQAMDEKASKLTSNPEVRQGIMNKLVGLLGKKDPQKKETAMSKLAAFGSKAVPSLIGALKGGDKPTKQGALETLGRIGPAAKPAEPEVKKATQSADPDIKSAAMSALAKIMGKK
ncbi:MAG: hypothetical protein H6728_08970 [Myxococcales bacterium]|nr:hypothetical protein [Myxococcales bacterium]MCB9643194.1 hypothetical protein [Myxococcales bacterium]